MKKALLLALGIMIGASLISCGGASSNPKQETETTEDPAKEAQRIAFETSKIAFDNVDDAFKMTEVYGNDIYEAWRYGVFDVSSRGNIDVSEMTKNTTIDEDKFREAVAKTAYNGDWDKLNDLQKDREKDKVDKYLTDLGKTYDSAFSACIGGMLIAYNELGFTDKIQEALDVAKEQMKTLSQDYSDYEHYPALKGYFTTTSSYFEFCQNPTGSFDQVRTTIDDYRNKARDYRSDLGYIFE